MTDSNNAEVQFIEDVQTATEYQLKHSPNVVTTETADGRLISATIGLNDFTHPQTEEHLIEWMAILDGDTILEKSYFTAGQTPRIELTVSDTDAILVIQAYCNLHGVFGAYV